MVNAAVFRPSPNFAHETVWRARGARLIAGVDEAGRGPLAGPVVAAAVIFDGSTAPAGIRDSKEVKAADRERLFEAIMLTARVGVGIGSVKRIDADNILQATMWAMTQAVEALNATPCAVLVDGNRLPRLDCPGEAIIKGDQRSLSIAAASIIAKVTRDRIMDDIAKDHPGYGFERHRGYPTRAHIEALSKLGPTVHHRRSFAPVAAVIDA